jgi:dipeptidyl aminopeptidase/acylaminoacyl peptidase
MDGEEGKKVAPCGTWKSPITGELVVGETIGLGQTAIDGDAIYWTELRPSEGGRSALVARGSDGEARDVLPGDFDVRSRVHEYGGGAFAVSGGVVYFVHGPDQRVYRAREGEAPAPITPGGRYRYADFGVHPRTGAIACVREDHGAEGEPKNEIVLLDPESPGPGEVVATGADFYAAPRWSPAGDQLAYLAWDHPNMPWDGTELWVASSSGNDRRKIAGGAAESIFQPAWSPEGVLHFASDRTGFWNLYADAGGVVEPVVQMEAEIGRPLWMFGTTAFGFATGGRVVFAYRSDGRWRLAVRAPGAGPVTLDLPYTEIDALTVRGECAVFVGGMPTEPSEVVVLDLVSGAREISRRATTAHVGEPYLSEPEPIQFPSAGGAVAHALYYPPQSRDFAVPEAEKPPLLVLSHGGPTGAASSSLRFSIQYWTSRGFAVVDVDYRGSAGYGRAYRDALRGRWGIADVEDCVHAARYLADRRLADPARLAIRGGSAGGYTTLQALTTTDTFAAGASHFGVSDLAALAEHTHKFESRYLDSLVGPYPAAAETYRERSPLHHAGGLSSPVIFFQGLEDKIVPPAQSERMADALRAKGIPVAYLPFEGERHGFRRAENIRRALEAELYFYGRVFGFEPADAIEPVTIENL